MVAFPPDDPRGLLLALQRLAAETGRGVLDEALVDRVHHYRMRALINGGRRQGPPTPSEIDAERIHGLVGHTREYTRAFRSLGSAIRRSRVEGFRAGAFDAALFVDALERRDHEVARGALEPLVASIVVFAGERQPLELDDVHRITARAYSDALLSYPIPQRHYIVHAVRGRAFVLAIDGEDGPTSRLDRPTERTTVLALSGRFRGPQQRLLELRFGLDGHEPRPVVEIADALNTTPAGIKPVEREVLRAIHPPPPRGEGAGIADR